MQSEYSNLRVIREPTRVTISSKRIGRVNWLVEIAILFISVGLFVTLRTQLTDRQNPFSPLLMFFCLLQVYRFITQLVDSDTIEITPERIKVSVGPLPAFDGSCPSIHRETLIGVETRSQILKNRHGNPTGTTPIFGVLATLSDGSTRIIIGGSKDPESIRFITNEIITFYHL